MKLSGFKIGEWTYLCSKKCLNEYFLKETGFTYDNSGEAERLWLNHEMPDEDNYYYIREMLHGIIEQEYEDEVFGDYLKAWVYKCQSCQKFLFEEIKDERND